MGFENFKRASMNEGEVHCVLDQFTALGGALKMLREKQAEGAK